MIFIMSAKQWNKDKKKLVRPKDYLIIDATEDDDARMNSFTNCVTVDSLNPPVKLVKLVSDGDFGDDDIIDYKKVEKLEKEFFKGYELRKSIMAIVAGVIEGDDNNVFIVMRNKAFKFYGKKMKKTFEKLFKVDFKFVVVYSGDPDKCKKELRYTFTDDELHQLKKSLKKRESEAAEDYKKKREKKLKKKK